MYEYYNMHALTFAFMLFHLCLILYPLSFIVPHVANVLGLRENKEWFDLIWKLYQQNK